MQPAHTTALAALVVAIAQPGCEPAAPISPMAGSRAKAERGAADVQFSFVVAGDTQFETRKLAADGISPRCDTAGPALPATVRALAPNLIFVTGDLVNHGGRDGAYDYFDYCMAPIVDHLPFFPTPGNHDTAVQGGEEGFNRFLQRRMDHNAQLANDLSIDRGPGANYAVAYGNALFISLDVPDESTFRCEPAWLESQLQRARASDELTHIFVFMHPPLHHTWAGPFGDFQGMLAAYEALFKRYDVTVVFSGHSHLYERFYVPDDGSVTQAVAYPRAGSYVNPSPPTHHQIDGEHVTYIVTGGAGGGYQNTCEYHYNVSDIYLQNKVCERHFVLAEVAAETITITVYRLYYPSSQPALDREKDVIERFVLQAKPANSIPISEARRRR